MQGLEAVLYDVKRLVRQFLEAVSPQIQTLQRLVGQKNIRRDLRDFVPPQNHFCQIFQMMENFWLQRADLVERHVQNLELSKVPGEDV